MSTHDESLHPRDRGGRWAEKAQGLPGRAARLTLPSPGRIPIDDHPDFASLTPRQQVQTRLALYAVADRGDRGLYTQDKRATDRFVHREMLRRTLGVAAETWARMRSGGVTALAEDAVNFAERVKDGGKANERETKTVETARGHLATIGKIHEKAQTSPREAAALGVGTMALSLARAHLAYGPGVVAARFIRSRLSPSLLAEYQEHVWRRREANKAAAQQRKEAKNVADVERAQAHEDSLRNDERDRAAQEARRRVDETLKRTAQHPASTLPTVQPTDDPETSPR